jgi:hypothetical protein
VLKLHLGQYDALEKTIRVIDAEVEKRIARLDKQAKAAETPLSRLIELLVSIPGVSYLSAITIISEIGGDMSRFRPPAISSPGRGCVLDRTRARANARLSPAQGRPLVEDHARSMRLGRQAAERQLLQGAVLSAAGQTRSSEGSAPSPPRS